MLTISRRKGESVDIGADFLVTLDRIVYAANECVLQVDEKGCPTREILLDWGGFCDISPEIDLRIVNLTRKVVTMSLRAPKDVKILRSELIHHEIDHVA